MTTSFLRSLAIPLAIAAVPVLASSTAFAENPPVAQARTTFSAPFQRYLLSPNGKPMGLMLADGSFIATPHHAMSKDAPVLTTGTRLDIEGVVRKTPTGTIVQHGVVKANGTVIADASRAHGKREHRDGEHHGKHHVELKPVSGAGQIAAIVSGPKGHVHAMVLTDGSTVVGQKLETLGLKVGDKISVAGMGGAYPLGKSMRIEKITLPNGQTRDLPRAAHHGADPTQGPA
jgi:hypothetical protein